MALTLPSFFNLFKFPIHYFCNRFLFSL